MEKIASKRSRFTYNPNQSPRSSNNRRYAKRRGWKFDPDFEQYRDKRNYLIPLGGSPPDNDVDCCR
jgi:hypothetical protein